MNPFIRVIPPAVVRFFAGPYVAGDSLAGAMDVAADLVARDGFLTTLDLLAEGIDTQDVVDAIVETYLEMTDAVASDARFTNPAGKPTISLKPSSYTTSPLDKGGDAFGSLEAIRRICRHAKDRGVGVTIDMEDRHWTDFTLDCLDTLHDEGFDNIGAVIQSRLHRSTDDITRLPPGIRVRVVIGIYHEPSDMATQNKQEMKERLLALADQLLERGHYVEFATHDEVYIRRFLDEVIKKRGIASDRFEIQMLYGVPRQTLLRSLVASGFRVRLYVPFAKGWPMAIAYLRRRLDEYPAMAFLVLRNTLKRG